jgi:hypothetical protein
VDLGYADESFTVYDHPKVLIFQRTEPLSPGEIESRILAAATLVRPSTPMLTPEDASLYAQAGTWRELFPANSWTQRLPILAWLLAVEAMALATWPLLARLLPTWPDRGFLLAKALGPVLVAYGVWLAASLRVLAFSPTSVLLVLGLVALISVVALKPSSLLCTLRGRWRALLLGETLFLAAFGVFVVVRMLNPDLFHPHRGGEKFLDLALLNGVLRSPYMPPLDPWFIGATSSSRTSSA